MNKIIEVDARLFQACDQFKSQEETRYYLRGVYVQPHPDNGAVMIATDGHRLIVAHDSGAICTKTAIVGLGKDAFAFIKKDFLPKIAVDADGIASCGNYRGAKTCIIDGVYPEWPNVITPILNLLKKRFHGKPQYEPASFDSAYLASFNKVAGMLFSGRKGSSMRLISLTAADPALILFPHEPRVFAVLMPMRANVENWIPAFMAPILEPQKRVPRKAAA